jgi:hypothetical protein
MTKLTIIGAGLFSLVLAGSALAASDGGPAMHRDYHEGDARPVFGMPSPGYGTPGPAYYRWRSGPYGDGNYPGNHDDYMRLPPSAHGG